MFVEIVITDRDGGWLCCKVGNNEALWCSRISEGTSFAMEVMGIRDGTVMLLDTKGG